MESKITSIFSAITSGKGAGVTGSVIVGLVAGFTAFALFKGKSAMVVNDMIDDLANAAIFAAAEAFDAGGIIQSAAAVLPIVTGLGNTIADAIVPFEDKTTVIADDAIAKAAIVVGLAFAGITFAVGRKNVGSVVERAAGRVGMGGAY